MLFRSHAETEGAAAAGTPSGPRGDRTEEKYPDSLLWRHTRGSLKSLWYFMRHPTLVGSHRVGHD